MPLDWVQPMELYQGLDLIVEDKHVSRVVGVVDVKVNYHLASEQQEPDFNVCCIFVQNFYNYYNYYNGQQDEESLFGHDDESWVVNVLAHLLRDEITHSFEV